MVTYFMAESDGIRRLEVHNDPKTMTCDVNIMVRENKLWLCIDGRNVVRIQGATGITFDLPVEPVRKKAPRKKAKKPV